MQTINTSFGPVTLVAVSADRFMGTFKPKIWPKVDLVFTRQEVQEAHDALGRCLGLAQSGGVRCHGDACAAGQLQCPTPGACGVRV